MGFAMTIGTQGEGIIYRVFSALGKLNAVMNFKIWRAIRCTLERGHLAAPFTMTICPFQNLSDYVRVAPENRRGCSNGDWYSRCCL